MRSFSVQQSFPVHTSLSNISQKPAGGAVVVGGGDPHAEVLTTRHPGHRTAVGGGGAVVGLASVSHGLHRVGMSSSGRIPGCRQCVRETTSSCLYGCWFTRSWRKGGRRMKTYLLSVLLLFRWMLRWFHASIKN